MRCSISRRRNMYGSGPRVAARYVSADGRPSRARTGSGRPAKGIVCRSSSSRARSRRSRGVSGRTTPRRGASRSRAFVTTQLNRAGACQGEMNRASHDRGGSGSESVAAGSCSVSRRDVGYAHQLLLAATIRQSLEVPADRGAHVVEMALLAHGRRFPARSSTPASGVTRTLPSTRRRRRRRGGRPREPGPHRRDGIAD